jgi:hypothetical protein
MNWFPNPASMLVRQIGSNWFYLIISNKIIVSRQVFCLFGTRTANRLIDLLRIEAMSVTEIVAKAIYESRNGRGCRRWSLLLNSHKEPYLADAKAAIDAYHDYIRRICDHQ